MIFRKVRATSLISGNRRNRWLF